jgi:DNA processing protein
MRSEEELKYILALQLIPKVGPVLTKNLIAYCGGPEQVFREKISHLTKVPGIGAGIARNILNFKDFDVIENEILFSKKHNVDILYFLDKDYPERLKDIDEAPVVLFKKGNANLNIPKSIGIVGTRNATNYGKDMTYKLVEGLAKYNVTVISGLAYGIDHHAHKACLQHNVPTIGVLAHGLDTLYPGQHRDTAKKMVDNGGLVTEFFTGTKPDAPHFPKRNRIVAGMVDALIMVETAVRGGSLITAEIAYSYNRELFAVPGRVGDEYSEGCNKYIRIQKACMAESAEDIAYNLGWDLKEDRQKKNKINLKELKPEEVKIVEFLQQNEKVHIDKIGNLLNKNTFEISVVLLDLEFRGFVQTMPGSYYKLKR